MKKSLFFLFSFPLFLQITAFGATPVLIKKNKDIDKVDDSKIIAAGTGSPGGGSAGASAGPSAANFSTEKVTGPNTDNFLDPKVLRDFVESKGLIECRQKEGKLTLAADVRARWIATGEKIEDTVNNTGFISQRGYTTDHAINVFKSEVNLFLDYTTPKAWVTTKLKWAAIDGTDGGSLTKVELDRAFIGYDIYEKGCEDFYIELGRSKSDYMFESRVQFASFFDGIHLFYTNKYNGVGTLTVHGGPFVIDSLTNHYGWVVEGGVKQLGNTNFSVKYSMIDWSRFARTYNYGKGGALLLLQDNPRYRFLVSQLILGHESKLDWPGCKILYLYTAVLANHDAKKSFTVPSYQNKAWYTGFTLGKLCKACDWSVDINYQYVQAQAVPEFDVAGIGHGNTSGLLLSDAIIGNFIPLRARGFTNYQGFEVLGLYALTDSLTLRSKASWSVPIRRNIGGDFRYKNFEMSVIFAF